MYNIDNIFKRVNSKITFSTFNTILLYGCKGSMIGLNNIEVFVDVAKSTNKTRLHFHQPCPI